MTCLFRRKFYQFYLCGVLMWWLARFQGSEVCASFLTGRVLWWCLYCLGSWIFCSQCQCSERSGINQLYIRLTYAVLLTLMMIQVMALYTLKSDISVHAGESVPFTFSYSVFWSFSPFCTSWNWCRISPRQLRWQGLLNFNSSIWKRITAFEVFLYVTKTFQ